VQLARISASTVNQKTNRHFILGALAAFSIITLVIFLVNAAYFTPWLTFITGLIGGFGYGRSSATKTETTKSNNTEEESED
jgi:hypothetical protein